VKVIVIGAGLGGLGVALRLQGLGCDVTVLEQRDAPGGRASRLTDAPRHGDLVTGGDEHDAAVEVPCRCGGRAPPFEEGVRHPHHARAATPMRRLYPHRR
jgi:monoamine oxidase